MVGGGQCSSVIVVILTLLGDDRGAPSGWRIIHSNNCFGHQPKTVVGGLYPVVGG